MRHFDLPGEKLFEMPSKQPFVHFCGDHQPDGTFITFLCSGKLSSRQKEYDSLMTVNDLQCSHRHVCFAHCF